MGDTPTPDDELRVLRRLVALAGPLNAELNLPALLGALSTAGRVATSTAPVLILGETGTGKELVARAVHDASRRAEGPFVPVNCAAIPTDLVASALFGHVKGAFTGAASDHQGYFEQADGGTIFLDEVGDLPPDVQAALLRALGNGEIQKLGGRKTQKVDARLVAATNRPLDRMVKEGKFREAAADEEE